MIFTSCVSYPSGPKFISDRNESLPSSREEITLAHEEGGPWHKNFKMNDAIKVSLSSLGVFVIIYPFLKKKNII